MGARDSPVHIEVKFLRRERMKLVNILVFTAGGAYAAKNRVYDSLKQLAVQYLFNNGTANFPATSDRGILDSMLGSFSEYGCWCYFSEGVMNDEPGIKGAGPAQDTLDNLCRVLTNNYHCSMLDVEAGGSCVLNEVDYNEINFFPITTETDYQAECTANNANDQCAIDACMVEGKFIKTFFVELFLNGNINHNLKHDTFDTDICKDGRGADGSTSGRSELECCGLIPERTPFNPKDGQRACCGADIFDTVARECCDDFTVQDVCE